jgi:Phospholipase_D-nuclease N-terminal
VMAIWLFIALFGDILRRDDLSGWGKAGWIVFLIVLPFLGALIYVIARPKVTPQDVRMMAQSEAAYRAAGSVSTADELTKLSELRVQGVLSEQEYEDLKRRTLAAV